mmetsp:Transcript_11976/g.28618  ORF Transcript_11976/g.28618 Transcript_11976/m.28618 type:complete len:203 (-) Transcript_11976:215-823(-)
MSNKAKRNHLDARVRINDGPDVLLLLLILVHLHLRCVFLKAEHDWQGRAVDVAIENSNFVTFLVEREGQVYSHRALSNSPFARRDSQDGLHILQGIRHLWHRSRRICCRSLLANGTNSHFYRLCPRNLGKPLLDFCLVHLHFKDQRNISGDALRLDLAHKSTGHNVRAHVGILHLLQSLHHFLNRCRPSSPCGTTDTTAPGA